MYVLVNSTNFSEAYTMWNSSTEVTEHKPWRIVRRVCFAWVIPLLTCVGAPTNAINCVVFWRQGLGDRMNICLFSLSLVDCCYLICTFIMYTLPSWDNFLNELLGGRYRSNFADSVSGFIYGLRLTSCFIVMVIAIERCVCVTWPLRASTLMSWRTTTTLIYTCFLALEIAYSVIPLACPKSSLKKNDHTQNMIRAATENQLFCNVFSSTLLGAVLPTLTLVVLAVSTTITIVKLRAAKAWRVSAGVATNSLHNHHDLLTPTLMIVLSVNMVTTVPFVAREIWDWFSWCWSLEDQAYDLYMAATAVITVFSELSSISNFFIFYHRSSRFRQVMSGVFSTGGQ